MDYSQGLPVPDGTGGLDSVAMGDLGAAGDAATGVIGIAASLAAVIGGTVLGMYSYKEAPMPASVKPLFKTGVKWLEPDPVLYTIATILEVSGVVGLIGSFILLRSSR
jgi:hypothetical protein